MLDLLVFSTISEGLANAVPFTMALQSAVALSVGLKDEQDSIWSLGMAFVICCD